MPIRCGFAVTASRLMLLLAATAGVAFAAGAEQARPVKAEVILRGGAIYTADPSRPRAETVALAGGRILAVGDDAEVAKFQDADTRIVELHGRMVLPGLHDSHVHPMSAGLWLQRCRLGDASNLRELRRAVGACHTKLPRDEWLIGRGWTEAMFGDVEPARVFDGLVAERPAVLLSAQGGRMWLNGVAFERLGFAYEDASDEGIERDAHGKYTGFVHGAAAAKVRQRLPQPGEQEYRRALRHMSALLNARGITSVTDASVSAPLLAAYRGAADAGELSLRVRAAVRFDAASGVAPLLRGYRRPRGGEAAMFREDMVKIFVDGDFPERNGALLEAYADAPGSRGETSVAPADLDRVVAALDAAGFDIHFHAMGDRAVRIALDAVEHAIAANGARDRRHQVAHLGLVDPLDLPRFRALGVIANLQLAWTSPRELAEFQGPERLGPERAARLLPFAALAAHGARLVAGSDGPAPAFDPFDAMEIAAARTVAQGQGASAAASRALPIATLLQAFTRNGAFAARAESFSGAIIRGHAADLIVLDRNLLATAPGQIGETRVLLTLIGGRAVHVAPGFSWSP